MPAARCDGDDLSILVAHFGKIDDLIALGVNDLKTVTDGKAILHVDLGQPIFAGDDVADILLT